MKKMEFNEKGWKTLEIVKLRAHIGRVCIK